jgi:hypothetical protein
MWRVKLRCRGVGATIASRTSTLLACAACRCGARGLAAEPKSVGATMKATSNGSLPR